jgi:hypothetical protein
VEPCLVITQIAQLVTAFAVATLTSATSHQAYAGQRPCENAGQSLPVRAPEALRASDFLEAVANLSEGEREKAIRDQLAFGSLPSFLRTLQPVRLFGRRLDGAPVRITLCVMMSYLSVGSDDDHVLMPMSLKTAVTFASKFGFTLPTRRMVDQIYYHAAVQLTPLPLPPGDAMRSIAYYRLHDAMVKRQRGQIGVQSGVFSAGEKKDIVLTARLKEQPNRVAIYGWHRSQNAPIQPLSTVHGERYADYSHGVRLVSTVVFVNGVQRSIFEVLADSDLASILSDEGPLPFMAQWIKRYVEQSQGS